MLLTRRSMLTLGAVAAFAGALPRGLRGQEALPGLSFGEARPFDPSAVRRAALALSQTDFEAPSTELPEPLGSLSYDQYRDIRFRAEASLWRGESLPYEVQLFHRGHVYRHPVLVDVVAEGQARRIIFRQDLFSYGKLVGDVPELEDIGFSGFRIHAPINRADYYDEFAVFQGASYFRGIGAGQTYGLSARGLAIATAEPEGEEFPYFRRFWIERPGTGDAPIVIHALLDSPSATGAYRFTLRPGETTVFDVEATVYPRRRIERVGLAPLTSMFFFGAHDRLDVDDFRPSVHDSDGLLIANGRGEWLWRPLINPATLQISSFIDEHPRGFGLMQRERDFSDFQDLEARYEQRPGLWIEPIGDWGSGSVILIEIPTSTETHDNIVAFWRPKAPLEAGSDHLFTYRMHWGANLTSPQLAQVKRTMIGRGITSEEAAGRRLVVIDYVGETLEPDIPLDQLSADVTASAGALRQPVLQFNPQTGGYRVSFELDPEGAAAIDLRCAIRREGKIASEVWVYRWSA